MSASESGAVPRFGRIDAGLDQVETAVSQAKDYLFSQQHPDGYWCGELEADTTLESDYIMVHTLLGTGDPRKNEARLSMKSCASRTKTGAGASFAGGPSNISASVKAYFAFKLMGYTPGPSHDGPRPGVDPRATAAWWNAIPSPRSISASSASTSTTRCPPYRLRLCSFPDWFYFNIYEISSWSRAILVPLSIAYAKKPFKKLAPKMGIDELFVGGKQTPTCTCAGIARRKSAGAISFSWPTA